MQVDSSLLPLRKDGQIETRPLYIEEWLETLPYIDFQKTTRLLHAALAATNQMQLKPSVRLELVDLYHQPYQYYIDAQIKAGAQHTLQSIETMQGQLHSMKQLAADLALASRRAMDESMGRTSLWGQSKPSIAAALRTLNYLSHALIFSFLEYAPTPKNAWQQLHFIYEYAESLEQQRTRQPLPGGKDKTTTIEHAYKKILLAALVDPHHLPFGAIWEIYEQLDAWAAHASLSRFTPSSDPAGCFVVNLRDDARPAPCAKFNSAQAVTKDLRLLVAAELQDLVKRQLDLVAAGTPDPALGLSRYYAKSLLQQMQRCWGLPPERHFPREMKNGALQIACGINPVHFHANQGRDFLQRLAAQRAEADEVQVAGEAAAAEHTTSNYTLDQWTLVNHSPGGVAVFKVAKPHYTVRVGELVGIAGGNGEDADRKWMLGVVRWLMVQNQNYRIGIQIIAQQAQPVAVRALTGGRTDTEYRRAFLAGDPRQGETSIITSRGLYATNRELEVTGANLRFKAQAENLLESAPGFEQFYCRVQ